MPSRVSCVLVGIDGVAASIVGSGMNYAAQISADPVKKARQHLRLIQPRVIGLLGKRMHQGKRVSGPFQIKQIVLSETVGLSHRTPPCVSRTRTWSM